MKSSFDRSLYVQTKTWMRDSHDLFDYESDHLHTTAFEANISGQLQRLDNFVRLAPLSESGPEAEKPPLLTLHREEGRDYAEGYSVRPNVTSDNLWLVVRFADEQQRGLELTRDSVIKLGRVGFKVKEVHNGSEDSPEVVSDIETSEGDLDSEDIPQEREENVCRICYESEKSRADPLLSQCKCEGSVKYIHLNCLKSWLRSKVTVRASDHSVTYQWKTLECEICKTELPFTLNFHGNSLSLFDFDKPQAPYIVLEAYSSGRTASKAMHVISMTEGKTSIRLGRGHESDIRINDISVSRCHALIRFKEGQFLIEDNSSKFGTLVKVNELLRVPKVGKVALQAGRSLVFVCEGVGSGKLKGTGIRDIESSE